MPFIKLTTQEAANALNDRVTQACLEAGIWEGGTNNYCVPQHEEYWLVPVLEGYEQFFTEGELAGIEEGAEQLMNDKAKGRLIIDMYLLDNRKLNLTTAQSLQQLQKFSAAKALLEVGGLTPAKALIEAAIIDEIFTQERKDKYLTMLNG